MNKLEREDLYTLEKYAEIRNDFRAKVIAHKKNRRLEIGPNASLYFEDRLVMQYQIQEILRTERIFEAEGINEELEAYNPLIPDGSNWKATFMIEFPDEAERRVALTKMHGVEDKTWMMIEGHDKVFPISDEDLERETEEKTSSVHFMRFELTSDMVNAVKTGAAISSGIDHERYSVTVDALSEGMRASLADDLD